MFLLTLHLATFVSFSFIHLMFMHIIRVPLPPRIFFIQESRLRVKLKSFSALGARLWNCLHPDWRKLTKRAFKRKLHKLLLTILGIEDYYVDAHSLILKINANNYCTL